MAKKDLVLSKDRARSFMICDIMHRKVVDIYEDELFFTSKVLILYISYVTI